MPTSIVIGEVPDAVREELAARAAVCGRSLEDYVRDELLALAQRPSAAVWMARVRARKDALQNQHDGRERNAPERNALANAASQGSSARADIEPPSAPRASDGSLHDVRCDVG
jgi:plasmid stability protein